MSFLGNLLWFILGGFVSGLEWIFSGMLCCVTIIGIPLGIQCFKFSAMSFCPFGKSIELGGGVPSFLANVIWLLTCGLIMAITNAFFGLALCVTIIGIPFGLQYFKIAKLALCPFGAKIVKG